MPLINRLSSAGLAVDGQLDETQNLIPSTYNSAVTETATASDVVQADRVWYGTVVETTTASDTTVGAIQSYITTNLQVMLDAGNPSSYPGSGTTWTDINPNGYTPQNFTLVGTTYSSGSGGYLTFNGTSAYAYSTYSYPTVNSTVTTYACWIQTSTASGRKVFGFENAQSGTGGSSYDKHLWIDTAGKAVYGVYYSGLRYSNGFPITDGTWHYVVAVYNSSINNCFLYIDGIYCGSTGGYPSADANSWLRIGSYKLSGWPGGGDGYWTGNMAMFQKYLSALTQANIRTNYTAWASRFGKSTGFITSGLTLYLNANNYSGSGQWLDQSGNGYNMTLYNSPTFTSSATTPYFSFNGSNQYMNNASYTTPVQSSTTSFTWIFLVNFTSGYNNYTALGNRGGGPPYNFMKITGAANNLFQLYGGTTGFNATNTTVYNIWTTIGISKNGSTISVYGSAGLGGGIYSTTQGTTGSMPFYIGGDPTAGEYSNCKVAAVAVYNRALTFAEFVQMDYFLADNYGA